MRVIGRAIGMLMGVVLVAGCDGSADGGAGGGGMQHAMGAAVDTSGLRAIPVPDDFRRGQELFDATCAACHGEAALGTAQGPPLVHSVYEPNHHADIAFILAAERGVRAHHWRFGDMPPQPGVTREEILEITRYVRWLQREAGVY